MTVEQVKYILNKKGFKTDEWTTLYSEDSVKNGIGVIALYGDNIFSVEPDRVQYYFDTDEAILYVQRYGGKPTTTPDATHSVKVIFNGKDYYFIPAKGQILDTGLGGPIAECISFNNICAFYDRNHSVYQAY